MNKPLITTSLFCFLLFIGSVSCSSDDDAAGCSIAWATDLTGEATALQTTLTAYSNDPSQANCDAVKAAYQAYIDALRPYGNCTALTGQDRSAWQTFLNDLEDELATIC